MCRWTFALMAFSLSAAGGEQAHQRRHLIPLHGIVDVPLLLPALDESGPPQLIQVMREGGPGDLDLGLDLAHRHLLARPYQEEEHLEPGEVSEGLERLHVLLRGLELGDRDARDALHGSKYMKLRNRCQAPRGRRARGRGFP